MNKKGIQLSGAAIVTLIILLASFLTIVAILVSIRPAIAESATVRLCHESVVWRTLSKYETMNAQIQWSPLACKTQDVELKGNREEIKSQMANLMGTCWFMFNEARHDDVFDGTEIAKLFGWEDNNNLCFMCYTASIEEDNIDGGPITSEEMGD